MGYNVLSREPINNRSLKLTTMRAGSLQQGIALLAVAILLGIQPAQAQFGAPKTGPGDSLFGPVTGSEKSVVAVESQFTAPAAGKPGRLFVTATIEPGWHIYSIAQPAGGPIATKITVNPPPGVRLAGEFRPTVEPEKKKEPAFDNLMVESHQGTITWYAPIELAAGVDPATLSIPGKITVQACNADSCLPPAALPFSAAVGAGIKLPNQPPESEPPAPAAVGKVAFDPGALKIAENDQIKQTSMLTAILMGFAGGLILNLMPCVLPVIGLKILSFVEQSGHSRGHAFMLNVWYSLGLLSVFLVLATLAVSLGFGWGQLFSYNEFNITLAAVVFAMGLSFLGVWEIPIPGFVGRGKALDLAEKEGVAGAFVKGVLTTILATPCSAPFLAPALTWAVGQPAPMTYAVFTATGLGMASPYLLIGAFPNLVSFLPKPGPWMDTFKQIMGFVLLGTVVFLLTFVPWPLVVPTVGFLFGLWGACWWIGRTPFTAEAGEKATAWLVAIAFAMVAGMVTFSWLGDVMQSRFREAIEQAIALQISGPQPKQGDNNRNDRGGLPWQPFTRNALEDKVAVGQTVLVDFTADWCLTCKTLEAAVLNTREVRDFAAQNGIVSLKADWTHGEPEVTKMLELLGSKQVPVLAIFPAGNPNQPIVLRGGYTQQILLDALRKAGPSKPR